MNDTYTKPFTQEFVLSVTYQQILDAINYSKSKTIARLEDLGDNQEHTNTVMNALGRLQKLQTFIEKFHDDNPSWFTK